MKTLSWAVALLVSFLMTSARADESVGSCAKFKCHEKPQAERGKCRDERRQCLEEHLGKQITKLKEKGGVHPNKKERMLKQVNERIERNKSRAEDVQQMGEVLQKHKAEIETLPTR